MKKKRIDVDDAPKGLTHNPFAALRGGLQEPSSEPAKAPEGSQMSAGASKRDLPVQDAKVVVRREKKGRGGKTVTRVTGLEMTGQELDGLKREMTRALGCGGTLEATDVVLQGELTKRAADWLGVRLGVKITIGN